MAVVYSTGFEIHGDAETEPTGNNRPEPPPFTAGTVGANGGVNNDGGAYVKSGRFSCTLDSETLMEVPYYSDSATREWWVSGWFKHKTVATSDDIYTVWVAGNLATGEGRCVAMRFTTDPTTFAWKGVGLQVYKMNEAAYGIPSGAGIGSVYTLTGTEPTGWNWIQLYLKDNADGESATLDSATSTTLTDTGAFAGDNWVGRLVMVGAAKYLTVTSHTDDVLTGSAGWVGGTPSAGSTYTIMSSWTVKLYVNDSLKVNQAAVMGVEKNLQKMCMGAYRAGTKAVCAWAVDDFIVNDSSGSAPYNGLLASTAGYNHQGYQPTNDLSDYDEWTASTGAQAYACVDDFNDNTDSANDYVEYTGGVANKKQMFCFADMAAGEAPVIVNLYSWSRGSGATAFTSPENYLAITTGESLADAAWQWGFLGDPNQAWKQLALTPGGAAWTESLFNDFKAGFKNTGTSSDYRAYMFGVECLGVNLTRPTENGASNDNAPCSLAAASAFVPRVMVF